MADMISNNRRVDKAPKGVTIYVHPFPEIQRSVKVGIAGVATIQALEETAILRPDGKDFMAPMACLGGVRRRDGNEDNSSSGRLVFDKTSQLAKGPVGEQPVELFTSSLCPDAPQVFHNNNAPCTNSADDTLADFMIEAPYKPGLSAFYLPEMPYGRVSAFALESAPQSLKPGNMMGYSFEKISFGGGGNIIYAKVNPGYPAVRSDANGSSFFGNCNIQEYILAIFGEIGTAYLPIAISLKVIVRNKKDAFVPSTERGKGATAVKIKGVRTLIVGDGKFSGKVNFAISASPLCLKSEFDGFAGKLGSQPEPCPHRPIKRLVQCFPGADILSERIVISILRGFGKLTHGFYENWNWFNFQFHCGLHQHSDPPRSFTLPTLLNELFGGSFPQDYEYKAAKICAYWNCFQYNEKLKRQFLPHLKMWASLPHGM